MGQHTEDVNTEDVAKDRAVENDDRPTRGRAGESVPVGITFDDWGYRRASQQDFVVRHLNLTIPAGQHVLLLGASGIGKSTLLEAMAGLVGSADASADEDGGTTEGRLLVGGVPASSPAARGMTGLMLQDPFSQAVLQRVGDNAAFGLENLGVPRDQIWPRVRQAMKLAGLGQMELTRQTAHLSGGQMQRLALAGALCMRPGALLLDEPTANLDPPGARSVAQAVRDVLAQHPSTLVLVEHRAEGWLDLIDRVVILGPRRKSVAGAAGADSGGVHGDGAPVAMDTDGTCIVADGTPDEVFSSDLDFDALGIWVPRTFAAGRRQEEAVIHFRSAQGRSSSCSSKPVISTVDLGIGRDGTAIASDISLDFRPGEVTALTGPNGVGKTTFALTLSGLLAPVTGKVRAAEALSVGLGSTNPMDWPSKKLATRVSYVFQAPEHQFVKSTVLAEAMTGPLAAGKTPEQARHIARGTLERMGLLSYADASPYSLSGGQKRRLTVASALAAAPRVLVLDEPTFGQDRLTWKQMARLIRGAADTGVAVVMVTHDEDLVRAVADRVVRFRAAEEISDTVMEGSRPEGRDPRRLDEDTARRDNVAEVVATPPAQRREPRRPASRSRFLAGLNPAARLLAALCISVPIVLTLDIVSAATYFGLVMALLLCLGFSPATIVRRSWPVWVAAPWSFLAVMLYGKPGGQIFLSAGWIIVSQRSLLLATATVLRLLGSAVPAVLFMLGIDTTDLADALSQVLRLPDRFVYGGLAGTRMVSVLRDDWQALTQARRSRGLGEQSRLARFVPQTFALLVLSIRRSTQLATAMQARGFGSPAPRTHARLSVTHPRDWWFVALSLLLPSLAVVVSVCAGTFAFLGGA